MSQISNRALLASGATALVAVAYAAGPVIAAGGTILVASYFWEKITHLATEALAACRRPESPPRRVVTPPPRQIPTPPPQVTALPPPVPPTGATRETEESCLPLPPESRLVRTPYGRFGRGMVAELRYCERENLYWTRMEPDGHCFFRALAAGLHERDSKSTETHATLRARAVRAFRETPDLHPFVEDGVESYLAKMAQAEFADRPIITALAQALNVTFIVHKVVNPGAEERPFAVEKEEINPGAPTSILFWHSENHFDALWQMGGRAEMKGSVLSCLE